MNNKFVTEEVEESIISYILLSPSRFGDVATSGLVAADFYHKRTRAIYEAMKKIIEREETISIPLLLEELKNSNSLELIGGREKLIEIASMEDTPNPSEVESITNLVIKKSQLRKAESALKEIMTSLDGKNIEMGDVINKLNEKLVEITKQNKPEEFQEIFDVAKKLLDDVMKQKNSGGLLGTPTGFTNLNTLTSGLRAGDLIILAARPAMGKTAFALNLASNVAGTLKRSTNNNYNVVFFSLEMPASQLTTRILSTISGVESEKFVKPEKMTHEDEKIIRLTIDNKIKKLNIYIDDTGGLKLDELIWKTQKMNTDISEKGIGEKVDLIIVDYLQLIEVAHSMGNNRQAEVAKISRTLKQLARDLNVPIIALSQLSRAVETRENKRPMMSDLRESGAIEQDADIIMFLYRDNYYTKELRSDEIQTTNLIIAKHRNGPLGDLEFKFNPKLSKFFEEEKGWNNEDGNW